MITKEENLRYFLEMMALHGIDVNSEDEENPNSIYFIDDGSDIWDAMNAVRKAHDLIAGKNDYYNDTHFKLANMAYRMELTSSEISSYIDNIKDEQIDNRLNDLFATLKNSDEYKNVISIIPDLFESKNYNSSESERELHIMRDFVFGLNIKIDDTKVTVKNVPRNIQYDWSKDLTTITAQHYTCSWRDKKTKKSHTVKTYITKPKLPQWIKQVRRLDIDCYEDYNLLRACSWVVVLNHLFKNGLPKVKVKKEVKNVK